MADLFETIAEATKPRGALVAPDQAAHWYKRDGTPLYTVLKKDGAPRNTTLADARKLDLVPSVTGIIGVIAKPALDAWKQEQAILSSLTLPRVPEEADEDFARRVVTDSKEQVGKAMDIGTEVHAYIESWLATTPEGREMLQLPAGVESSCRSWIEWVRDFIDLTQPGKVEVSFASSLGYGGRVDWYGALARVNGIAVVDWKTQFVKTGKEPNFYESWDLQLSAYAKGIEDDPSLRYGVGWFDQRISVVISTNPDNQGVWAHTWPGNSFEQFEAALTIWKWLNAYDPSQRVTV